MQLFIGGSRAGKRYAVTQRFDIGHWHTADTALDVENEPGGLRQCRVVDGWSHWIEVLLDQEPDDDCLRERLAARLDELLAWELSQRGEVVLIMLEMGRGIVPMDRAARRLRDLNGWLTQDAAGRCERVWYVWNGLVKSLRV